MVALHDSSVAADISGRVEPSPEWPFGDLPRHHYGAIYADPPWAFNLWWGGRTNQTPTGVPSRATVPHYQVMREADLSAIPVGDLAADDCVLVMWTCWPVLEWSLRVMRSWGFEYKTCGFCWVKAHAKQIELFQDDITPHMTLGYWTRSNSEVALLGTRGHPKRQAADVRQAIIEPRREHSRKPDIHERIERLVAGPYVELFARTTRPGWDSWGLEVDKFAAPAFDEHADALGSYTDAIRACGERHKAGEPLGEFFLPGGATAGCQNAKTPTPNTDETQAHGGFAEGER